jgi:hypothetical protein
MWQNLATAAAVIDIGRPDLTPSHRPDRFLTIATEPIA